MRTVTLTRLVSPIEDKIIIWKENATNRSLFVDYHRGFDNHRVIMTIDGAEAAAYIFQNCDQP